MAGQIDKKQLDENVSDLGTGSGIVGTALDIANLGRTPAGLFAGGLMGPLGMFTGGYGMASAIDDMSRTGVGLQNSADLVASGASAFGGAAGLLSTMGVISSVGAVASAGQVAAAGAAGYGAGTAMAHIGDSDYARSGLFGYNEGTKQNKTVFDVVTEQAVRTDNTVNDWIGGEEGSFRDQVGDAVGTGLGAYTAGVGSILAAPIGLQAAAAGWAGSLFD